MRIDDEQIKKIRPALQNLIDALVGLSEGCGLDVLSNLELSGTIQHFEFCYELSWKLLQKRGAIDGRTLASPREAFRYGFEKGYIQSELDWSHMIQDRNLTVYTYNQVSARKIYGVIKTIYFPALSSFVANFEEDLKA